MTEAPTDARRDAPADVPAEVLPVASLPQTWRVVRDAMRGRTGIAWLAIGSLAVSSVAAVITPLLVGRIVDIVTDSGTSGQLGTVALGALAATALSALLVAVGTGCSAVFSESVLGVFRERVMARVVELPLSRAERAGRGAVVQRTVGDVAVASDVARGALPAFVSAVLTILFTLGGLFVLDWRLALAGLLPLPLWILATRGYLRRSGPQYAAERTSEAELSRTLMASVSGARTVRALVLEDHHMRAIERRSSDWVAAAVRACVTRVRFSLHLNGAELLGLLAVFLTGAYLVRDGAASLGMASAAVLFWLRLFEPVGTLLYLLDEVQSAGAALARLAGVITMKTPAERVDGVRPPDGALAVRGLTFGYGEGDEDDPVLRDVGFRVGPGERVAIVGPSGAGKSTVVGLIAGVHTPRGGSITVGGIPVAQTDPRSVGLVTQEIHVFAGTVADNLRLAGADADEEAVNDTLSQVGALGWASSLPDGVNTVVGAGGHRLSAAQARQLALARLILANPLVAVVDEPTAESHGGDRTVLDAAVDSALEGRTAIVIAHRLTDARAADRILVLDGGRVVEQGSHDELLRANGLYAELWASWSRSRRHPAYVDLGGQRTDGRSRHEHADGDADLQAVPDLLDEPRRGE